MRSLPKSGFCLIAAKSKLTRSTYKIWVSVFPLYFWIFFTAVLKAAIKKGTYKLEPLTWGFSYRRGDEHMTGLQGDSWSSVVFEQFSDCSLVLLMLPFLFWKHVVSFNMNSASDFKIFWNNLMINTPKKLPNVADWCVLLRECRCAALRASVKLCCRCHHNSKQSSP